MFLLSFSKYKKLKKNKNKNPVDWILIEFGYELIESMAKNPIVFRRNSTNPLNLEMARDHMWDQ